MAVSTAHSRSSSYLQLVPAVEYDHGKRPSITVNQDRIVVEVHKSEGLGNGLWYRLGQVSGGRIDWWSETGASIHRYDFGIYPRVSMNSRGVVVEVHQSQFRSRLRYHVGVVYNQEVNTQATAITWGESHKYDNGVTPAIALRDDGTVIEVHEMSGPSHSDLYYLVGMVDATNKIIDWGPPQRYGKGAFPSVTFNMEGVVVEMHQSQVFDTLRYRVGKLSERIIEWGASQVYERGINPYIAINGEKQVIEVHESNRVVHSLWHNTGEVDTGTRMIHWSDETSQKYDHGRTPAIATSGDGSAVVEVHETEHPFKNTLWYHTGAFKFKRDH